MSEVTPESRERRRCSGCAFFVPSEPIREKDDAATRAKLNEMGLKSYSSQAHQANVFIEHPAGDCHFNPPRTVISVSTEDWAEILDTPRIRADRIACRRWEP